MKFSVHALASNTACVEDFVAWSEPGHIGPHRPSDTGGVPAQRLSALAGGCGAFAHFHVNGVHRNRIHLDEQIPARSDGIRELLVQERVQTVDRSGFTIGDGTHDGCSR
jgi:hypothetical protein